MIEKLIKKIAKSRQKCKNNAKFSKKTLFELIFS